MTVTIDNPSLVLLYKGITMAKQDTDLLVADQAMLKDFDLNGFDINKPLAEKYKSYIEKVQILKDSYLTAHIYQDSNDGQVRMILHIVPPTSKKQLSYEGLQVSCKKGDLETRITHAIGRFGYIGYGANYHLCTMDNKKEEFAVIYSVENEHVITLSLGKEVNNPFGIQRLRQLFKI